MNIKWLMSVAVVASTCWTPTQAADLNPVLKPALVVPPKETHYVGLGWSRSKHLLSFPVLHPLKTISKATFGIRHPLMAFEKFGKIVEPYQAGMNFVSAASGPVTAAGIFSIHR